jgi:hypothetical protein
MIVTLHAHKRCTSVPLIRFSWCSLSWHAAFCGNDDVSSWIENQYAFQNVVLRIKLSHLTFKEMYSLRSQSQIITDEADLVYLKLVEELFIQNKDFSWVFNPSR